MVGSAESALIAPLDPVRYDILTILRAGIDAASAGGALARALADDDLRRELRAAPVHVIAAGKAAAHMAAAWLSIGDIATRRVLVVGTHQDIVLPPAIEWHEAGHPLPDARSVAAAVRALDMAGSVPSGETLVLLLSGGASALLARPIPGISLEEKQQVVDLMLRGGADIHALNTVRKHISSIKGGRLAAACRGAAITLAISDVVGDDLAVIGSGPAWLIPRRGRMRCARSSDSSLPASSRP